MAIACVYCGGEHPSASLVRQCWEQSNGQQKLPVAKPEPRPEQVKPGAGRPFEAKPTGRTKSRAAAPPDPSPPAPSPRHARVAVSAQAGPDVLGRNLIIEPGQSVPSPWTDAERVFVDADTFSEPAPVLTVLRAAGHARQRIVIELHPNHTNCSPQTLVSAVPVLQFGGLLEFGEFEADELVHLIWSNAVDLRDPDRPRWEVLDGAVRLGARPAGGGASDTAGDIVLPNGDPAWIDGGPVRHTDPIDGIPVVHAVAIEHGSLRPPGPNVSGADLAPDQLAAVTHPGGVARIIAPAGSGKTRVLTERARLLLDTWNLPPSAVSLVAFNKRAQEEMTERTADLPRLQVRTLNAIALAIVNGMPPFAPQKRNWRTIDEIDVRRIIGDLVTFPRRRNSDPVAPWIEALSLIRLGLLSPDEVEGRYDGEVDGLVGVWPRYREALDRMGAVDFDDQIYRALEVLLGQPDARARAQRASRMLLVDEFQDLAPAHLLLIRLLAAPGGAVFGVGDDDQTIYGYNGASPSWLIDFEQFFPGAGSHPLEVNYRCPAGIVDAVDRLLRHNQRRVPKSIRAAVPGEPTDGWRVDADADPVGATRAAVHRALEAGVGPTDIAVLSRVNAILAPVQVALVSDGVPIAGGVGLEFVERTAVKTVLSWLRLATAEGRGARFDPGDMREALRRPSRSFHPRINDWVTEQGTPAELVRLAERLNNEKDAERVLDFASDIGRLASLARSGASTAELLDLLINDIGLARAVTTLDAHRRGMNRSAQGDDLTALQHLAGLHDRPDSFGTWLRNQLAVKRSAEGVTLATVHRVKGQEWPHVVVHLADVDQYPHRLAEDTEEERRLFHVAMTRASRQATIVTGAYPSPFVAELTTEPAPATDPVGATAKVVRSKSAPPPRTGGARPSGGPSDAGLFDALCALRHELRDGKPAYVVFDNKTAEAIAGLAPTTKAELLRVPGIGPAKVEKYGDVILEVVSRHS